MSALGRLQFVYGVQGMRVIFPAAAVRLTSHGRRAVSLPRLSELVKRARA